ncbi:hypothetical protein I6F36_21210 [Bradyrhizobium sp. BRP19]|uniref:hypothetical protein n=1 Tax=Bradyrhizobium sp. BRP19 TaxID=2793823 RepID=UPI001CD2556A|nr:hypothetical protein [Bradyrhizobium sp. BRP19]MCA1549353.1 hypothetical protein [Bradyrhizobium sp. BRP19]
MTEPQWTDEMLTRLIDEGSLASLAEHANDPWLKVRLRATTTKVRMFPTYVKAQVYAYVLRDRFKYTPASREAFLVRHVLPNSGVIAASIANLYRDDQITNAANSIYSHLKADPAAMEAMIAEVKSLIDQPQNTPRRL